MDDNMTAKLLLIIILSIPTICHSKDFSYGAWRKVTEVINGNYGKDHIFLMINKEVNKGTEYSLYNWKHGKIICCIKVSSSRIDQEALDKRYHIPAPWVADLINDWDISKYSFRPIVYLSTMDNNLSDRFPDLFKDDSGGVLVPPGTTMGKGNRVLIIDGREYQIRKKSRNLADGDGMIDEFSLVDVSQKKPTYKPIKIQIPYGIF